MMNVIELQTQVVERLKKVIDPETGADVMRMRLVQDIQMDPEGNISYTFRPSSPLCPIAVPLVLSIIQAINEVAGINKQKVNVIDYVQADELNEILKSILED